MGIKEWGEYQRGQGNAQAAEIADFLHTKFGDVPGSVTTPQAVEQTVLAKPESRRRRSKTPEQRFIDAVEAYTHEKHTPKLVNGLFVTQGDLWEAELLKTGEKVSLTVPTYSDSQEVLDRAEAEHTGPILVPVELSTQENRYRLGLLYPEMRSYSVQKGNPVANVVDQSGILYVEMTKDAPYLDTTEDQLKTKLKREGRRGLTLNSYIIGSQTNYQLNGEYFDQGATWSRMLGSVDAGKAVFAYFYSDGSLFVYQYLRPGDHHPYLGGRSEGV